MIKNNIKLSILGALAIFFVSHIAAAAKITLKNNTYAWNIKYRTTFAANPQNVEEKLLKPGESVNLDANNISIRRSGLGSSVISSWTDVPLHDLLLKSNRLGKPGYTTVLISTGLGGGWGFNVAN